MESPRLCRGFKGRAVPETLAADVGWRWRSPGGAGGFDGVYRVGIFRAMPGAMSLGLSSFWRLARQMRRQSFSLP
jgi:hypothetical protein